MSRGFTLLELLVAIALMALIAGSLYGSLYVGFKAQRSATSAVEPARTASLTLELLGQDFDAAMPPTGVLAGSFIATDGSGTGETDSLTFFSCANVPAEDLPGGASDIRRVELAVAAVSDESEPALLRRVTTNLLASTDQQTREQVLCRRVKAFNLRYYDGSLWLDSWDSAAVDNTLPLAIEVALEFTPGAQSDDTEHTYRITRVYRIQCGRYAQDAAAEPAAN